MALAILGSLGGVTAFSTLVYLIVRGIFKEVTSIDANTIATDKLTKAVSSLEDRLGNHETRISILEDRDRHRGIIR